MHGQDTRRIELVPSHTIIAGEIRKDLRFRPFIDTASLGDSGNYLSTDSLPEGQPGYNVNDFDVVPSNLIDGKYYEIKSSTVGLWDIDAFSDSITHAITNDPVSQFNNGAISLDGLFVPYNTSFDGGGGILPHFEAPDDNQTGVPTSRTLNPFNPLNLIPIESGDLLSTGDVGSGFPAGLEGYWLKYGHNIAMALSSDLLLPDSGVEDFNFEEDYWSRGKVEVDGIRSIAHRAPLILSGWGYDTEGNPVPSVDGTGIDFHPELPYNSSLWKTGPLDARWDDSRKVWSAAGTGGGVMAFGTLENVNCSYDYRDVLVEYANQCVRKLPDINVRTAEDVKDPLGVLNGVSESEQTGATVVITHVVDYDDCAGETGRWIILAITGLNHCPDNV